MAEETRTFDEFALSEAQSKFLDSLVWPEGIDKAAVLEEARNAKYLVCNCPVHIRIDTPEAKDVDVCLIVPEHSKTVQKIVGRSEKPYVLGAAPGFEISSKAVMDRLTAFTAGVTRKK